MEVEENHKGKQCPYKNILCQEGYCSGCQVFLDWGFSLWDNDIKLDKKKEETGGN